MADEERQYDEVTPEQGAALDDLYQQSEAAAEFAQLRAAERRAEVDVGQYHLQGLLEVAAQDAGIRCFEEAADYDSAWQTRHALMLSIARRLAEALNLALWLANSDAITWPRPAAAEEQGAEQEAEAGLEPDTAAQPSEPEPSAEKTKPPSVHLGHEPYRVH